MSVELADPFQVFQIRAMLRLRTKKVFGQEKKGCGLTTSVDEPHPEICAGSEVAPIEVDEDEVDGDSEGFLESRNKIHRKRGRPAAAAAESAARKYRKNCNAIRNKRLTASILDRATKESATTSIFKPGSASTPDFVPIPGVILALGCGDEVMAPFSRPEVYITQVEDELSHAFTRRRANYDLDSEDEDWLSQFNDGYSESILADETFELIIDALEKVEFCSRNDSMCGQVSDELCSDLHEMEVVEAVHSYWEKKRKKRKSALVRVFEAHKVKKTRGRKKNWKRLASRRTKGEQQTTWGSRDEDAVEALDVMGTVEAAQTLADLAIKRRTRAQFIMTNSDLMMYRAKMAIQIAESAWIIESQGISPTELVDQPLL